MTAAPTKAARFTIPDSLGENPFPSADPRYAKWIDYSVAVLGGIANTIWGLHDLVDVIDEATYLVWHSRHPHSPEHYNLEHVASLLGANGPHVIYDQFDRIFADALKQFVFSASDSAVAARIVDNLSITLGVVIGDPMAGAASTEWKLDFAQTYAVKMDSPQPSSSDAPVNLEDAPEFINHLSADRGEYWVRSDANYSEETPEFFRPIGAKRLMEIAVLRKAAEAILTRDPPGTKEAVISRLMPAVVAYAVSLFDAMAEAELLHLGSEVDVATFGKWLNVKCLPEVIVDASQYSFSQFPVTIGLATGWFDERSHPSTRGALWGAYVEFYGGSVAHDATRSITTHLEARRAHWKGMAEASKVNQTAVIKASGSTRRASRLAGDGEMKIKKDGLGKRKFPGGIAAPLPSESACEPVRPPNKRTDEAAKLTNRQKVEGFLHVVKKLPGGIRANKKTFWSVAGYHEKTAFEAWQRNDPNPRKNTFAATQVFERLLKMEPSDFLKRARGLLSSAAETDQ